jgi:hypothetical protein
MDPSGTPDPEAVTPFQDESDPVPTMSNLPAAPTPVAPTVTEQPGYSQPGTAASNGRLPQRDQEGLQQLP